MAPRKKPILTEVKPQSLNAVLKRQNEALNQLLVVNQELRDVLKAIRPAAKLSSPNF